jgi:hypothetical protein
MTNSKTTKPSSKYSYDIKLSLKQDAWNWFVGANRIVKGINVDWSKYAPKEVVELIRGKSEAESLLLLEPYLKQKYIDDKEQIKNYKKFMDHEFNNKFIDACNKVSELTSKPLYRDNFTFFLTTFPREPYNTDKGYIWVKIGSFDPVKSFMHELIHFQFFEYWATETSVFAKLDSEQFEILKESLTVILDESLIPLIINVSPGYKDHQELRKKLHDFWLLNKDFDKLITFGLRQIKEE